MQDPWVKFAKHSSIMFVKAIMALVSYFIVFGYLLHLPQCSAWKRGQNNLSFNGALFCRQNFALKTDILRKVKTFGEIQCAFVCLSENDCVAQTYCDDSPRRKNPKGTCYLHKNGVKNEENSARLVKSKRCTFQQYMDLDEVSCSRKCQNGMKCQYDYDTRKCQRRCEPPYTGIDCNQLQAISFRFTTLGAQGNSGPISTAEYVNTSLQGTVTLDKGVQIWRVPFTALYRLKVAGASGGKASSSGGKGAIVAGVLLLTKGTVLHLLIGQKGLPGSSGAGGGGGTFVVSNKNTLLVAAGGGGGGGGHITSEDGDDGQAIKAGSVYGGVNGLGGSVCAREDNNAGGGAGFKENGKCSRNVSCSLTPHPCNESGLAYVNGGLGGNGNGVGGFGGGGAAYKDFGGGGGGYSGGGVHATSLGSRAGGGGSYWAVGRLKSSNDTNSGDGYVLIDFNNSLRKK